MELRDRADPQALPRPGPGRHGLPPDPQRPPQKRESFEVTVFEPPSRLAIRGRIGPFQATAGYLLEPVAGGTRLTNHVELEPSSALLRLVGPLAVPSVKAAVARNLTALQGLLEGTRPAAEGAG